MIKSFSKAASKGKETEFLKGLCRNLFYDKDFLNFLIRRLKLYIKYGEDRELKSVCKRIAAAKSPIKVIENIADHYKLNNQPELCKRLCGLIAHSYILWKDKFDLKHFNPLSHNKLKSSMLTEITANLNRTNSAAAILLWGSFLDNPKVSMFSDIDLFLVINDDELLNKKTLYKLLLLIFPKTSHYNLPTNIEFKYLHENGVARCGVVKDGVFISFIIGTKSLLENSTDIGIEYVAASIDGFLTITSFQGKTNVIRVKNRFPVYPILDGRTYTGIIPNLLYTSKIMACKDKDLRKELTDIKTVAIANMLSHIKNENWINDANAIRLFIKIIKLHGKGMTSKRLNNLAVEYKNKG